MTQRFSFRQIRGAAVDGPWHRLVRFSAKELALALAIVVICLLAGGASLQTAPLIGITQSTRSQLSALGADILDRDGGSGANDDGYVEGLEKVLGL